MTSNTRPRAVVTGASSGIGAAFAERLARDGFDLIVVARRRDRLAALAQRLHDDHGVKVEVLAANLSEPGPLRQVEARIAADPALEMLVNNAGFGGYRPFIELDPEEAEALIQLKVLAVTRLTHAALPGMLARGRGAIINVSSRLAFSAPLGSAQLPKRAIYAAANAYINTFTQLLHSELEGSGVQVQALCPGVVATEFHAHVGTDVSRFPPAIVMQLGELVDASLKGLDLGEVICIPAMQDSHLLAEVQESQQKLFEQTRSGAPARRYRG